MKIDILQLRARMEETEREYLAYLETIPSVRDRTAEQQDRANDLDAANRSASRAFRKAERDEYWERRDRRIANVHG